MAINHSKIQNVLRSYDRQLSRTRQLNKLKGKLPENAQKIDQSSISEEAKRKQHVHNISLEIRQNLLVSQTSSPLVQEVKETLEKEFGSRFFFHYLPKENQIGIRREDKGEVTSTEKDRILNRLWEIIQEKVDKSVI